MCSPLGSLHDRATLCTPDAALILPSAKSLRNRLQEEALASVREMEERLRQQRKEERQEEKEEKTNEAGDNWERSAFILQRGEYAILWATVVSELSDHRPHGEDHMASSCAACVELSRQYLKRQVWISGWRRMYGSSPFVCSSVWCVVLMSCCTCTALLTYTHLALSTVLPVWSNSSWEEVGIVFLHSLSALHIESQAPSLIMYSSSWPWVDAMPVKRTSWLHTSVRSHQSPRWHPTSLAFLMLSFNYG